MAGIGIGLAGSMIVNLLFTVCWFTSAAKRCTRRKVTIKQVEGGTPQHESTKFYEPPHIYRPQPTRQAPTLAVAPAPQAPAPVNQSTMSSDLEMEISFDMPPPPSA